MVVVVEQPVILELDKRDDLFFLAFPRIARKFKAPVEMDFFLKWKVMARNRMKWLRTVIEIVNTFTETNQSIAAE